MPVCSTCRYPQICDRISNLIDTRAGGAYFCRVYWWQFWNLRRLVPAALLMVAFARDAYSQGFPPELGIRGNAQAVSEIDFSGGSQFGVVQTAHPLLYQVGTGSRSTFASRIQNECEYSQQAGAVSFALANYGELMVSGSGHVWNSGYASCPTPVFVGVPSTAPGRVFAFGEPQFQDTLRFLSATLAPGATSAVRVSYLFHNGGRQEIRGLVDPGASGGIRYTNEIFSNAVTAGGGAFSYRTNGAFLGNSRFNSANGPSVFTNLVQIGGVLSLSGQLNAAASIDIREGGPVARQQFQYDGQLLVSVEPLDPAVSYTTASGASYSRSASAGLSLDAFATNALLLRIPPGKIAEAWQPGPDFKNWTVLTNRLLVVLTPTNAAAFFRLQPE